MTRTVSEKHPGPAVRPAGGPASRTRKAPAGKGRRLPPRRRKAILTLHVTVAVGWVGIEIAQLLLGLVGLFTDDEAVVRATHVVMEILGIELIAGIAWMTLLTGLLLSAATQWGLLKHYWIVVKLVLTVVLMLDGHFFLQHWLREQAETGGASESLGLRLVVSMSVALVLLVAATALSVYKPWGKTRRGRRPAARSARP
ncbi:hypothetical protein [Streptomyces gardneri]|uniref:DUF2269 domain-containing protein n=1 Tax=Streptomyces gardneri TaxID=66892 RepID=A0A4Y3RCT5_9ACTN|nr:hypothetical protein [Streptomyces gardneri]GEB55581.1 hypothetical protein SGA01_11860 [Streptomyces gardneri]GHH14769.1 hypothetical protein GCM10017674_63320 [Streptomyces gardneri]